MTSPAVATTEPVEFLLGIHQPAWLTRAGVPVFVSDTRLRGYKTLPVAAAPVAYDSGGFSELRLHGRWTVTPTDYVARLRRYRDEIGRMLWAAPQDWMCEDLIINGGWCRGQRFVGTHLTVAEHQRRTVLNYLQLRDLAPDLNIIPVVQGNTPDAYRRCVDLYWSLARIDLTKMPLVGVGSVCRLQGTAIAGRILTGLRSHGITRVHTFGFKTLGLTAHGHLVTSADSQSWSAVAVHFFRNARKRGLPHGLMPTCVPGPHHPAKNCANCLPYALSWRGQLLTASQATIHHTHHGGLFDV